MRIEVVCACVRECVLCNVYVSSVLHMFRLLLTHQILVSVRIEIVCVCVRECVLCNVYVSSVLHMFRLLLLLTHQFLVSVRIEIVFGVRVCVFD